MSAAGMRLTEQVFGCSAATTSSASFDTHLARLTRANAALAAKKVADAEVQASLEALGWPADKIALVMGAGK